MRKFYITLVSVCLALQACSASKDLAEVAAGQYFARANAPRANYSTPLVNLPKAAPVPSVTAPANSALPQTAETETEASIPAEELVQTADVVEATAEPETLPFTEESSSEGPDLGSIDKQFGHLIAQQLRRVMPEPAVQQLRTVVRGK